MVADRAAGSMLMTNGLARMEWHHSPRELSQGGAVVGALYSAKAGRGRHLSVVAAALGLLVVYYFSLLVCLVFCRIRCS